MLFSYCNNITVFPENKGFCLLEVLVGMSLMVFGVLLLSSVLSQIADYSARTNLLLGAIDRAIVCLDKQQVKTFTDGPYEVSVCRENDKRQGAVFTVDVSWKNRKEEQISLTTVALGELDV